MKILYGVQATGNGHIARARSMARAFAEHPVQVDYLLSGRARQDIFGAEPFGDFAHRRGLTFDVRKGRVRYLATARKLPLARAVADIRGLDLSGYDLVISDFEPITAWAARLRGTPSLGISHQLAFRYDIPTDGANPLARSVLRAFAPVRHRLGLHWDSFGHPIIPPLIDLDGEAPDDAVDDRCIVVYLPFECGDDILELLAPFDDYRFLVYMGVDPSASRGHVSFRRFDKTRFQHDLHRCAGVICNAGFELPSECIHLGKRLLVKPVYGQMEQMSNVRALLQLGYGHRLDRLDAEVVGQWLCSDKPPPRPFGEVARGIASWVVDGHFDDPMRLARALWTALPWQPASLPGYARG